MAYYACMYSGMFGERPVEGVRPLKVEVTGICRMPSLLCGAEIQTLVLMVSQQVLSSVKPFFQHPLIIKQQQQIFSQVKSFLCSEIFKEELEKSNQSQTNALGDWLLLSFAQLCVRHCPLYCTLPTPSGLLLSDIHFLITALCQLFQV